MLVVQRSVWCHALEAWKRLNFYRYCLRLRVVSGMMKVSAGSGGEHNKHAKTVSLACCRVERGLELLISAAIKIHPLPRRAAGAVCYTCIGKITGRVLPYVADGQAGW